MATTLLEDIEPQTQPLSADRLVRALFERAYLEERAAREEAESRCAKALIGRDSARMERDAERVGLKRCAEERDELKRKLDALANATQTQFVDAMDRSPVAALLRISDIVGLLAEPDQRLDRAQLLERLCSRVASIIGERDTACRRLERVAHRLGLAHNATSQELVEAIDAQSGRARLEELKTATARGYAKNDMIALINSMLAWEVAP